MIKIKKIRKIISKLLDVVFVKKCVACQELLPFDYDGYLCKDCLEEWTLSKSEVCPYCMKEQEKCRCGFHMSELDSVRHLAIYSPHDTDSVTNKIVYALKRSNVDAVFEFVSSEMCKSLITNKSNKNTVCVGVPRNPKAIRKHGYDHAKKLAKQVAEDMGFEYVDALYHKGGGMEQKELKNQALRMENAKKNCYIKPKCVERIRGKRVILIDDIGTTGSMANACCKLLKKNGAYCVECVLCARNESN